MNRSQQFWARVLAAGLGGAAAATFVGAVGFMLGQEWFGTGLFMFQPAPGMAGLVGTALIGALGCAVGLLVGVLGVRFALVNGVLGGFIGLVVAAYEVLANAARFTAYELTVSLTAVAACLLAAVAAGWLGHALSKRNRDLPSVAERPDQR